MDEGFIQKLIVKGAPYVLATNKQSEAPPPVEIAFWHTLFPSHTFAAYVTVPDCVTVPPADPVFSVALVCVDNLTVGTSFSKK